MRSAFIAAAFAATVIAVPMQERAVVTNTDFEMVYVTDVVTVTRGAAPTQDSNTQDSNNGGWGNWGGWGHKHKHHKHKHTQQPQPTHTQQPTTTWEPAPTSEAPAPSNEPSQTKKSAPAPGPTDGSYSAIALHHHNIHRHNHSSPDVTWSDSLVASAKQIAQSCIYAHNTDAMGGGYGQNIAAGVSGDKVDQIITNMFYDSEVNYFEGLYGQSDPKTNFEHWGHFSQIVWANTQSVGCYTMDCSSQGLQEVGSNVPPYFTVCNYQPPGNVAGQYANNIAKSIGEASVVV